MKIQSVKLDRFKRFSDLTISEIPESAKLILLVGPNGSGKTSLFEAFNHWYRLKGFNNPGSKEYFEKKDGEISGDTWYNKKVILTFHGIDPNHLAQRIW